MGIESKCSVNQDMWTSSDVLWGTSVQFSMLAYSPNQRCRKCTGKLKPRNRRKPVAHIFHSWMGERTQRFLLPALPRGITCILCSLLSVIFLQYVAEHSNASSCFTDDEKIAKCCGGYYLASSFFFSDCQSYSTRRKSHVTAAFPISDQVVEEPWLLQPSLVSHHLADVYTSSDVDNEREMLNCSNGSIPNLEILNQCSQGEEYNHKSSYNANVKNISKQSDSLLTNDLVEEPWIFESICSGVKVASGVVGNELVEDEVTQTELCEQHQPTPENLLHEEENNVTTKEDSVSTVILINSSICTVQRIAVLENDKLVELLLEPVKTNVQCDSVYLGVVTKLVPHMGGAFVNIGSPRPSFMDIRPYKGPFVFPSFHSPMEETEVNGSIFNKSEEQADFPENEALSNEVEEPDEVEDDQSEDDDVFEHHEDQINFDVLDVIRENLNGSIIGHGVDAEKHKFEHLDGEADQLQTRSQPQDAGVKVKENKWKQVKKGSKIIVQVVKEGLGTKGPTLTAYPKLRSRFWVSNIWCPQFLCLVLQD